MVENNYTIFKKIFPHSPNQRRRLTYFKKSEARSWPEQRRSFAAHNPCQPTSIASFRRDGLPAGGLSGIPHAFSSLMDESIEFPVNGVVHHFPGYRSFSERFSPGRPETPFSKGIHKACNGGRQKGIACFEIADSFFNRRHFLFLSPSGFRGAQRVLPGPGVHRFST